MKFITSLALATGMASFAAAQFYPTPTPDDITWDVRNLWCIQQRDVCPAICQDQSFSNAEFNDCDPDTLAYSCVCEDGKTPNLTEYSVTIPYNICQWSKQECVNNCKGEATCSAACFTGKTCGASDPRKQNGTSTAKTTTASMTGTAVPTGTGANGEPEDKFDQSAAMGLVGAFEGVSGVVVMVAGVAVGVLGLL